MGVYGIVGTVMIDARPDGNTQFRIIDIAVFVLTIIELLLRIGAVGVRNTLRSIHGKIHAGTLLLTIVFLCIYGSDRNIVYLGLRCRIISLLGPLMDQFKPMRTLGKTVYLSRPVLRNVFFIAVALTLICAFRPIKDAEYADRC